MVGKKELLDRIKLGEGVEIGPGNCCGAKALSIDKAKAELYRMGNIKILENNDWYKQFPTKE